MNGFSPSKNVFERPLSSANMSDLHIYVVPSELWEEQQNLAFNQIINETISAGFIRINAEKLISDVRIEIDHQLGYEVVPKDYVFCKSVGRCLAQVRGKQENILKVKHFLPPNSYCPELFIVDSLVIKRSQTTSDSSKTINSISDRPYLRDPYPNSHLPELQSGRSNKEEIFEKDQTEEENLAELNKPDNLVIIEPQNDDEQRKKKDKEKIKKEREKANFERDIQRGEIQKDPQFYDIDFLSINIEPVESRRKEIDDLQKEIMRRYKELDNLERSHENKLKDWEADEENRRQEEIERRKMFEQMEKERIKQESILISKQKEELKKLEELLTTKQKEIKLSEDKLNEEKINRIKLMKLKEQEIEDLQNQVNNETNNESEIDSKLANIITEIQEMELRQKQIEEDTLAERIAAENEFKRAQIDFENLRAHWEEEKKNRDHEYADRMAEEERLRNLSDQKRNDHELRMEEERRLMIEEREKFLEEQRHWEEEKQRYEEEEKQRMEEMELAIQNARENKPSIQKFEIKDPELLLEGSSDIEQITYLKNILKSKISERKESEKRREDIVKKIRATQMFLQTKRNQIRDMWKKRYFDEKKKTPPLEDQLNRYKEEIEELHKKLLAMMESGFKEHNRHLKQNGIMSPSNKANLILQATRIHHDIEDLHHKINHSQMRLSAEMKLRAQTETELKILRIEAMQNKIRLSRTRSDQLAIMVPGNNSMTNSYDYTHSPRNKHSVASVMSNERFVSR